MSVGASQVRILHPPFMKKIIDTFKGTIGTDMKAKVTENNGVKVLTDVEFKSFSLVKKPFKGLEII